jgi:hypothetical protein
MRATRFPRTRLVLEAPGGVRPLLAFGISGDGGLIVDLSKHSPLRRFRYGVVDIPPGEGELAARVRAPEAGWAYDIAPKLHYHRSGWLTINATGRDERQGVQAPALADLDHVHVMTFICRHPHLWGITGKRASDMVFRPEQQIETLTVACWIGGLDNLKQPHRSAPENPAAFLVDNGSGVLVPTVVARLRAEAVGYYVWLELHANRKFGEGPDPLVMLHAHDHTAAKNLAQPFSMIGVWSVADDESPEDAMPVEQIVVRGSQAQRGHAVCRWFRRGREPDSD